MLANILGTSSQLTKHPADLGAWKLMDHMNEAKMKKSAPIERWQRNKVVINKIVVFADELRIQTRRWKQSRAIFAYVFTLIITLCQQ